jgi:adenylylsulfate kinase-like enzyme
VSDGTVWLITGTPGAGKTSVARALCKRFPRAIHIPVDDLRGLVVSGRADPLIPWTAETEQQFRLSWETAGRIAARYADEGFVVAIDDVAPPRAVAIYERSIGNRMLRKVLLAPALDTALQRNELGRGKEFDTAVLVPTIRDLHATLVPDRSPWLVIDSSNMSVTETVDAILTASSNRA